MNTPDEVVERLRKRAAIRRSIPRGEPDRIADQLEEAADTIMAIQAGCEKAEQENTCDACAGTGKPASNIPCMCKGTGKMSVAALTLREELTAAEAKRVGLEKALRELIDLKELKVKFENERESPYLQRTWQVDYERRKPLAWVAASAALATQ